MIKRKSAWETESTWDTEEGFDLARIKKGVAAGERHHALRQYLGWLIKHGWVKSEAKLELIAWNSNNRPPLPTDELHREFEKYWKLWTEKTNK